MFNVKVFFNQPLNVRRTISNIRSSWIFYFKKSLNLEARAAGFSTSFIRQKTWICSSLLNQTHVFVKSME